MSERWRRLLELLGEITDLRFSEAVLSWDQQTYMPPGGAESRASQVATLQKLAHRILTSDEVGSLLSDLEGELAGLPDDSFEVRLHQVTRRRYEDAVRIPPNLVLELARTSSLAFAAWLRAKSAADFAVFRPHLERMVELQLAKADALGYQDSPYDALLRVYEPDLDSAQVTSLFEQLRVRLVPLVAEIGQQPALDDSSLRQHYPESGQWQLCLKVLELMGFDLTHGRLDKSEHPFTTHFGSRDIRLTTHINTTSLGSALMSAMHEGGHGLYEQGIPWDFQRTPLAQGATLSIHESQSRLWENLVGRSRVFWQHFLPIARQVFPQQFRQVGIDGIYRAMNRVEPSLIRVDADEVTYNLHIFIRFELEQGLITGQLAVGELVEAWRDRYEHYLGVTPSDDATGVLQDVHWAHGLYGYFPTYALGNIVSVQFWNEMMQEPGLPGQLLKGRFTVVRDWLRENVHVHGAKFTTQELVQRVTGSPLQAEPYLDYIERKYRRLYEI